MVDLTNKKPLARGKRGVTYTAVYNERVVLVKEKNPRSSVNTLENEAEMLEKVNRKGIGPKLILANQDLVVMEFIDGPEFMEWADQSDEKTIKRALVQIFDQCKTLDLMGISKKEMTRPYKHILMKGNTPIQIDFERATQNKKPQNVTQLCQWIVSSKFNERMCKRGVSYNKEKLRMLAKKYKNDYTDVAYHEILEEVLNDD